jgi:t-SNARE complex subunit (syntaxin)
MAQDFHAAFGLDGADDKHISVVDESGVALAAIQGLNQKLETEAKAKDAEIQAQAAKIEDLQQSVAELKALVGKLANK